jgi:hypothetical protein
MGITIHYRPCPRGVGATAHATHVFVGEIHNALKIQLGCETLLDTIDDFKFGFALLEIALQCCRHFFAGLPDQVCQLGLPTLANCSVCGS